MFTVKRHCEYCPRFIVVNPQGFAITLARYDREGCVIGAAQMQFTEADAETTSDFLNRTLFPDDYLDASAN